VARAPDPRPEVHDENSLRSAVLQATLACSAALGVATFGAPCWIRCSLTATLPARWSSGRCSIDGTTMAGGRQKRRKQLGG
jgi:hypothetical protein